MALQLALDARIPASFGGVDGRALYLDCEGGFSATRARELAHGLAEHLAWIPWIARHLGSQGCMRA